MASSRTFRSAVEAASVKHRLPKNLVRAVSRALVGRAPATLGDSPLSRLEIQALWRLWPKGHKHMLTSVCRVLGPSPGQGHVYKVPANLVPEEEESIPGQPVSGGRSGRTWVLLHSKPWSEAQHDLQLWAASDLLRLAETLPEEVRQEAQAAVYGALRYGAFAMRGEDYALYSSATGAEAFGQEMAWEQKQVDAFFFRIFESRPKEGAFLRKKKYEDFAGSYLDQDPFSNSRAVRTLVRRINKAYRP